jgi:branched-chain amino acid transport system permease protein
MIQFGSSMRGQFALVAAVMAASGLIVTFTSDSHYLLILTLVPIWAVMGLSWNLLGGYLGLVSFGQAAFFGLGAFTVVILAHDYGVTPWIGLTLAAFVGGLAGVLIGAITFRFRGFYFALAMLAYPLALLNVFEWAGWNEVAIPMHREAPWRFMQFEDPRVFSWIALAMLGVALIISLWIERSRFGLSLFAIRQNEIAARVAGIPAFANKLKAIAISGVFAAIAGGLYALVLFVVTPVSVFGMLVSAQALIITMFGGRGTAWGAAIGAAVLVPLSEWLHGQFGSTLPGIAGAVFGLAIIMVVLLLPNGIYWSLKDWIGQRNSAARDDHKLGQSAPAATLGTKIRPPASSAQDTKVSLLDVRGMNVSFGGVHALQDVSFSVHPNEILGIIGPNGAGKTTLFNVLSGLVRPHSGTAILDGSIQLTGKSPEEICATGIGRTFQTVRVFRRLTLLENVAAGAFVKFSNDDDALKQAWRVLDRVGLAGRATCMGGELDNRELRLMELARALAAEPQIVLLDECLAGLSSDDIGQITVILRRLRDEGLTIAIIEHTMDAMARLADRMVVMDHGTVLVTGAPQSVLRNSDVISAYLGKRWAQYAESR